MSEIYKFDKSFVLIHTKSVVLISISTFDGFSHENNARLPTVADAIKIRKLRISKKLVHSVSNL